VKIARDSGIPGKPLRRQSIKALVKTPLPFCLSVSSSFFRSLSKLNGFRSGPNARPARSAGSSAALRPTKNHVSIWPFPFTSIGPRSPSLGAGAREILECRFEGRPIRDEYLIVDKSKLAGTGAHATRSAATGRKNVGFLNEGRFGGCFS
jgi:hypothetical protein